MSNTIIRHTWRTDRMLKPHDLSGFAFVSEAQAHTFIIDGFDGKNAVPIEGTVTATCLGATGVTNPLIGEINEDGMAVVTMTHECYAVPGQFDLTVYATANDVTQAIYEGIGVIKKTETDTTAYPTETIPNLVEMVEQVNAAIASIPPASAQLISDVENVVLVQQTEPEEENNKLWVPTEDMQEVQVPTYAEHEALSDEVQDLKSAIALQDENIPDTVQTIAFDSAGNIQSITHMRGNVAVRTDTFTFADTAITEVRTLNTGEKLTVVTNTDTLQTTVTYAAA